MDTASSPTYRERSRGKSQSRTRPESRTDYAIGICLLLVVVFLWTTSNFVTQVRVAPVSTSSRSRAYQDLFEDGYEKPFLYVLQYFITITTSSNLKNI